MAGRNTSPAGSLRSGGRDRLRAYFSLDGFTPFQADHLDAVAGELRATFQAGRSCMDFQRPNILVIPGTLKRAHHHANVAAASIALTLSIFAAWEKLDRSDKLETYAC